MTEFTIDTEHPVHIKNGNVHLDGILHIPQKAQGLVIFVHGSGSSRFSTRNQHVAQVLNQGRLATLLFDLLTPEEELIDSQTSELRFDINFLSERLIEVTKWCRTELVLKSLKLGYFGASTGAAAALVAAARQAEFIKAVVSRGGRPDLAAASLSQVKAPTLLIVGGDDVPVIQMNKTALAKMNCAKELKIVPGATHLFEEAGTLDEVARLAMGWFNQYL